MKLGVLDQVPIREGDTVEQALAETFELAQAADQLGYSRYWLAEHHNTGSLACTAPEILIPQVAARTQRIRVGSGGIMLPHYSSFKVAETFALIDTLYPGRIDLGIGRAPGSDGRTARALAHGPGSLGLEHFPEQLADVYGFLSNDLPDAHPFHGVRAFPNTAPTGTAETGTAETETLAPARTHMPELWLLGSSTVGGMHAAELGWAFSFAQFISPEGGEDVIRNYKKKFEPSPMWPEPRASMGVSVTCADTEEEAEELSWARWFWRIKGNRGVRGGIPHPDERHSFDFSPTELEYVDYLKQRSIYGTPAQVRDRLEEMAKVYDVDECIVLTITYNFADRLRSYELVAKEFDLPVATDATTSA